MSCHRACTEFRTALAVSAFLCLVSAALLAGCGSTPVGVDREGRAEVYHTLSSQALETGEPSF